MTRWSGLSCPSPSATKTPPKSVVARGLVDTGSTFCGVTGEMVEELGIDVFGEREVITPMGTTLTSVPLIN